MNKSSNILITGASGFVGSHVVDEALRRDFQVWAGIRKSSSREFLIDDKIQFVDFNYSDSTELERQLSDFLQNNGNIDYVIHCAGITKSIDKKEFDEINFHYTKNLLDALNNTGHSLTKFVFVSSLSVMGKGDEIHYTPFKTSDIERPDTAYGQSKLSAEQYLKSTAYFPYIILRPTGVYGPRDKDYLMMAKSVKSGFVPSIGFEAQQLTFVYVEDLARLTLDLSESDIQNRTYLVSDGDSYTDAEYTSVLKDILKCSRVAEVRVPHFLVKIIACFGDAVGRITGRSQTINSDKYKILKQKNWNCDTKPLIDDLEFHFQYNLEKGMRKTIAWYKEQGWL